MGAEVAGAFEGCYWEDGEVGCFDDEGAGEAGSGDFGAGGEGGVGGSGDLVWWTVG